MQEYQQKKEEAKRKLRTADHMLTMSYPMLKEPKILLSVAMNLLGAAENAIAAILEYERDQKRIPPYNDTAESRFNIFRERIVPTQNIDKDYVKTIISLKETIQMHKSSAVEFTRKNKFVMASDDYELRSLTDKDLKKHLQRVKGFINILDRLTP